MNCRDPNSLRSNAGLGCRRSTQTNKSSAIPEAARPAEERRRHDAAERGRFQQHKRERRRRDRKKAGTEPIHLGARTLLVEPIANSARHQNNQECAKRQVDPKNPTPPDRIGQQRSERRASDHRGTDDRAPKVQTPAHGEALVGTGKEGGRGAGDASTGDTLQRAECQQNVERGRARTQQRSQAKQPRTPSEHLNASVSVGKATCNRQTEDQGKAIDVDGPGRSRGSGAEVAANVGQGSCQSGQVDLKQKAAQARCKRRRRFQGHAIAAMAVVGTPTGAPRFIIILLGFVEHDRCGLHRAWMAGQQALVE